MTSQIVSASIDENYPIAGQDNDSQGFRDNFSIIKDGLATASSEITVLQSGTAKLNAPNNFNGTLIENALTNQLYGKVFTSTTAGTTVIDYRNGEYQIVNVTGNHSLRFVGFAGSDAEPVYAKIKLELSPNSAGPSGWNVTFTAPAGGSVTGTIGFPTPGENPIINVGDNADLKTIAEVWTTNGVDFYASLIGSFSQEFDLESLTDVILTSPTQGQVLLYNSTSGKWVNDTPSVDIGSIESLENVEDVTYEDLVTGDILKWNGVQWAPATDPTISELDGIPDVSVSTAIAEDFLKFNGTNWVNSTIELNDLTDVTIGGDPTNALNASHVVKYDGTNWINTKLELDELKNVSISEEAECDVIRYNATSQAWRNESDPNIHVYQVSLPPNFDGDDGYEIDGTVIEENLLTFHVGNIYRFNLNNPTVNSFNEQSALRFSTDAAGTQPYITNVRISGTAGTVGSYIEIEITKDTPTPLYIYGSTGTAGAGPFPLGQDIPIAVIKDGFYTGSEDLASGDAASTVLSASYFSTSASETATLAAGSEGQIKTFAMHSTSGDMVITVSNAGWKSTGTGTITFDTIGQACTLQYLNSKWFCIGNNGAAFA